MSAEEWLPIPGYEGRYCVSNHGNVMSMNYMTNIYHIRSGKRWPHVPRVGKAG